MRKITQAPRTEQPAAVATRMRERQEAKTSENRKGMGIKVTVLLVLIALLATVGSLFAEPITRAYNTWRSSGDPGFETPLTDEVDGVWKGFIDPPDAETRMHYSVTVDGNGGLTEDDRKTYVMEDLVDGRCYKPEEDLFHRDGYEFIGYSSIKRPTNVAHQVAKQYAFDASIVEDGGTLYAQWEKQIPHTEVAQGNLSDSLSAVGVPLVNNIQATAHDAVYIGVGNNNNTLTRITLSWGGYSGHAFCINPGYSPLSTGTYSNGAFDDAHLPAGHVYNANAVRAALYYGYEGPCYQQSWFPWTDSDGSACTSGDYYVWTHLIVTYLLYGDVTNTSSHQSWRWGLSSAYQTWAWNNILNPNPPSGQETTVHQMCSAGNNVHPDFCVFYVEPNSSGVQRYIGWVDSSYIDINLTKNKGTHITIADSVVGATYSVNKSNGDGTGLVVRVDSVDSNGNGVGVLHKWDSANNRPTDALFDSRLPAGTYKIKEFWAPKGYALDPNTYTVASVYDNPTSTEPEVSTTATIKARKRFPGGTLTSNKFKFTLYASNGTTELESHVGNDANGLVTFAPRTYYWKEGTTIYHYYIKEDVHSYSGVSHDSHVVAVEVKVTGTFNGTAGSSSLTVDSITYSGASETSSDRLPVFVNEPTTPDPIDVTLKAHKQLNKHGVTKTMTASMFSFTLEGDDIAGQVETMTGVTNNSSTATGVVTFAPITYTSAGTHTYTIKEVQGSESGVVYDTHTSTVTVTVTKTNNVLNASVSYSGTTYSGDSTALFTNDLVPPTSITLKAHKRLNKNGTSKTMSSNSFSFKLTGNGQNQTKTMTDVDNSNSSYSTGLVTFDPISFSSKGTYTYYIDEVEGSDSTIDYDDHTCTVTVTVTQSGHTLSASASYSTPRYSGDNTALFTNDVKVSPASVTLKAHKRLNKNGTSTTMSANSFSFKLSGTGITTQTKNMTNVDNSNSEYSTGLVTFDPISYTSASDVGLHTYTIKEVQGSTTGILYDTHTSTVTVNVTMSGSALSASVQSYTGTLYDDSTALFTNNVVQPTDVTLKAHKKLNPNGTGITLTSNMFTFNLYGPDSQTTLKESKSVSPDSGSTTTGTVTFTKLTFTADDVGNTYTYYIKETQGTRNDINYDSHTETVTITVTLSGNNVQATPTYSVGAADDGTALFTNDGVPPDGATISLQAYKQLNKNGADVTLTNGMFAFSLYDSNNQFIERKQLANAANTSTTGTGSVTFSTLTFGPETEGNSYTYYIKEDTHSHVGISHDDHTETVTISVTKNASTNKLVASATYSPGQGTGGAAKFVNEATKGIGVTLKAHKHLNKNGANVSLTNDAYKFTLCGPDSQTQVKQASVGATVDSGSTTDGTATFATIPFGPEDVGHTYTYYITEDNPTDANVVKDTHRETVTIAISQSGTELSADVAYSPGEGSNGEALFTNDYTPPIPVTLSGTKTWNQKGSGIAMTTGMFEFKLYEVGAGGAETLLDTKTVTATSATAGTFSFNPISYTRADLGKTHNYVIRETEGDLDYATYDTHTESVSVTISENADHTLKATTATDTDGVSFTNTYGKSKTTSFEATKTLKRGTETQTLTANQFSFVLTKADDTVLQTKPNTANGSVSFDPIEYTQDDIGNTYTYKIREVAGDSQTIVYDETVKTVTVAVTSNASTGDLILTKTYQDGVTPQFVNYVAETHIDIDATKVFDTTGSDQTLTANKFSFTLHKVESNGTETLLDTKGNAANGKVSFDRINYDKRDANKTFTYKIREVQGTDNTIKYDTHEATVTVKVDMDATTKLMTAAITSDAASRTFNNSIRRTGTATISAQKSFDDRGSGMTMSENMFSFQLKAPGGSVIQTVGNNASGAVQFAPIEYQLEEIGQSYTYTIHEVPGTNPHIHYDTHDEQVKVDVGSDTNGNVKTTVTYLGTGGKATFENWYEGSVPVTLLAKKTFKPKGTGKTMGTYSFVLTGPYITGSQTKTNNSSGDVTFDPITYTEADINKTYQYTIKETPGTDDLIEYDSHEETVSVRIYVDGEDLKAQVTYSSGGTAATFLNCGIPSVSTKIDATKVYQANNSGRTLGASDFSFQLVDAATNQVVQTKPNAANGTIQFDSPTYWHADLGPHTYKIREVQGSDPNTVYDTHEETVTVNVTENEDGSLSAVASYDADGARFTNSFQASTTVSLNAHKVLRNDTDTANEPLTAGFFTFQLLDSSDAVLQTKTNAANGDVQFDAISYTQANIGQTFTYKMREVPSADPSIRYDDSVKTVTVAIGINSAKDKLTTTVSYDATNATFTNHRRPSTKIVLRGQKTLTEDSTEGTKLEDDEYTFELLNDTGTKLLTTENDADGAIVFDEIEYDWDTLNKSYTYAMAESIGDDPTVVYDEHQEPVTVAITTDADGELKATATYDASGCSFANTETVPSMRTTLKTKDGQKITRSSTGFKTVTLIDTVTYSQLVPGRRYKLQATLHQKGEGGKDEGVITGSDGSATFVPTEPDGTVDVEITLDYSQMTTSSFVAFERLYYVGEGEESAPGTTPTPETEPVLIVAHEDINDADQSMDYEAPEIATTLATEDGDKDVSQNQGTVTLIDTVSYKGLMPGTTYEMAGTLHSKEDGKAIEGSTGSVKFTPEKSEGTVEVPIPVDTDKVTGPAVAFESLSVVGNEKPETSDGEPTPTPAEDREYDANPVATHEDLEDEAQTVTLHAPEIATILTDADGNRVMQTGSGNKKMVDTVSYKGLLVGKEYELHGTLHARGDDKTDKGAIAGSTGSVRFKPEQADGAVKVEIPCDTTNLTQPVVAFEELYLVIPQTGTPADGAAQSGNAKKGEPVLVAEHKDINDAAQSVTMDPKPESRAAQVRSDIVQTGDAIVAIALTAASVASVAWLALWLRKRKA